MRADLAGHNHPSPFGKIDKMALFYPWMKFDFFGGPIDFIRSAKKVPFCDFIQNMSQVLSNAYLKGETGLSHEISKGIFRLSKVLINP